MITCGKVSDGNFKIIDIIEMYEPFECYNFYIFISLVPHVGLTNEKNLVIFIVTMYYPNL